MSGAIGSLAEEQTYTTTSMGFCNPCTNTGPNGLPATWLSIKCSVPTVLEYYTYVQYNYPVSAVSTRPSLGCSREDVRNQDVHAITEHAFWLTVPETS